MMHVFGDNTEANREQPLDIRNARFNISRWEMLTMRSCRIEREDVHDYGIDKISKVSGLRFTGG